MAWSSPTTVGGNGTKAAGTTLDLQPSAAVPAGAILIVGLCSDNIATADGATSTVVGVTDTQGNSYTKVREWTRAAGSAGSGVTIAVFVSRVSSALATSDTITATWSASLAARQMIAQYRTVGDGNTYRVRGSAGTNGTSQSPSVSLSGQSASTLVWYGLAGLENTGTWTHDADYTQGRQNRTTTSGDANSNVMMAAASRATATITSDTFNPVPSVSGDWAAILLTLEEVIAGPSASPPLIDRAGLVFAPNVSIASTLPGPIVSYRAGDLSLSDGDPVVTWPDRSGNAKHATQANPSAQPIYRASSAARNLLPLRNQTDVEQDTSGFGSDGTGVSITRSELTAYQGRASLRVACDGGATQQGVAIGRAGNTIENAPVQPGLPYTASVYARGDVGGETVQLSIRWRDAASTHISTVSGTTVTLGQDWTRLVLTATAPESAAWAAILVRNPNATAQVWFIDANMLEQSSQASPFEPPPGSLTWTEPFVRFDGASQCLQIPDLGPLPEATIVAHVADREGRTSESAVLSSSGAGRSFALISSGEWGHAAFRSDGVEVRARGLRVEPGRPTVLIVRQSVSGNFVEIWEDGTLIERRTGLSSLRSGGSFYIARNPAAVIPKSPRKGFATRDLNSPNVGKNLRLQTIQVWWQDTEAVQGTYDWSSLDADLAAVTVPVRLRPMLGRLAPDWAKQLGNGPITYTEPQGGETATIPDIWSAEYQAAARDWIAALAAHVDPLEQVITVYATGAMTYYGEPCIRGISNADNRAAFLAAGYTQEKDQALELAQFDWMLAFERTNVACAYNAWQFIKDDGTAGSSTTFMRTMMDYHMQLFGERCTLANNSVRSSYITDTPAFYAAFLERPQVAHEFQLAAASRVGDETEAARWAVSYLQARVIEISGTLSAAQYDALEQELWP